MNKNRITPEEYFIIRFKAGGHNNKAIAGFMGKSKEKIEQMEEEAIKKLKRKP